MRRATMSLFLAGAIALAIPQAMYAQRGGHSAGGGHASGFSGSGGIGARGFGGSFAGTGGFSAPRSFPAPRMNFPSGSTGFGSSRSFATYPQRSWPITRSPFGQLRAPAVNRGPYPSGANRPGVANNRSWGGQPSRGGRYPGKRYPYRPPYRRTVVVYASPLYATPWFGAWPYFGNWNDFGFDDSYASQANAAPDQSYAPQSESPSEPQEEAPPAYPGPAYQPGIATAAPGSEPALTIVYKDGHSQQVRNYALTRTTLLLLDDASSGRTQQISVEQIDLPATEQVNRAAGVDFSLPVRN
jgi:hypothetical protein